MGRVGLVFPESLRTRTTQGRHWAGFRLGGRASGFLALFAEYHFATGTAVLLLEMVFELLILFQYSYYRLIMSVRSGLPPGRL